MGNFVISVEYDGNSYVANYFNGTSIELDAADYTDAVLEADSLLSAERG